MHQHCKGLILIQLNAEKQRLHEANTGQAPWRHFGPYLSERQWGTVREDYSAGGDAWNYTNFDIARSYAYRWGEEGLAGFCDTEQLLCLSLALWNGKDGILKDQLFGLSGPQGNHGEDVKELYYFLDATPTHSYQKLLYKYPQAAFPYEDLLKTNKQRTRLEPEYELLDTGIFAESRYFDVFVEVAKASANDLLFQYTLVNRGPEAAPVHVLPQLWFRNTWAWGLDDYRPRLAALGEAAVQVSHRDLSELTWYVDGAPALLFCDNNTNVQRLDHHPAASESYFKDGLHEYVVNGNEQAVNPAQTGTKAAAHFSFTLPPGESCTLRLRLGPSGQAEPFADFDQLLQQRQHEADAFYQELQRDITSDDARLVQRQAFAGMLWSKQFYNYDVPRWLAGDPALPSPPPERLEGRNAEWDSLTNYDIISMPDTWEYPWYAAWDLAFHCLPLAQLDPEFAKNQLRLLCHDWYMHPNGQLPAYEWHFSDVNPPVHAWACFRVFKIDQKQRGGPGDIPFLETVFHRLLLNFTWWVNRKDRDGHNIFQGGFLGLDNIGVFDRSAPLPFGGTLEQADGTAWVAMFALNMMRIALELSQSNPVYQDLACKFFEHFLYIAEAMTNLGDRALDLWDNEDEFYYDALNKPDGGGHELLKVRSMVGLIPLFAVEILDEDLLAGAPAFLARMNWLLTNRPHLASLVSHWQEPGKGARRLLSLLRGHRMKRLLDRMLDPAEFFSDHGIRSLSRVYLEHPYVFEADGDGDDDATGVTQFIVNYQPAESQGDMFGGNSNWRGPVWFPVNFLIVESLQRFYHYYGDDFKVECPTHSGNYVTIQDVADEISRRLTTLFLRDEQTGRRTCFGTNELLQNDPQFRDYLCFHEYFDGDTGKGLGASHQTGWTGLVAKLLQPIYAIAPHYEL